MAKNPQIPVEIKLQYEKAVRDFQRTVSEKLANITVGLTVPQNNIQAAIKAIQKGIKDVGGIQLLDKDRIDVKVITAYVKRFTTEINKVMALNEKSGNGIKLGFNFKDAVAKLEAELMKVDAKVNVGIAVDSSELTNLQTSVDGIAKAVNDELARIEFDGILNGFKETLSKIADSALEIPKEVKAGVDLAIEELNRLSSIKISLPDMDSQVSEVMQKIIDLASTDISDERLVEFFDKLGIAITRFNDSLKDMAAIGTFASELLTLSTSMSGIEQEADKLLNGSFGELFDMLNKADVTNLDAVAEALKKAFGAYGGGSGGSSGSGGDTGNAGNDNSEPTGLGGSSDGDSAGLGGNANSDSADKGCPCKKELAAIVAAIDLTRNVLASNLGDIGFLAEEIEKSLRNSGPISHKIGRTGGHIVNAIMKHSGKGGGGDSGKDDNRHVPHPALSRGIDAAKQRIAEQRKTIEGRINQVTEVSKNERSAKFDTGMIESKLATDVLNRVSGEVKKAEAELQKAIEDANHAFQQSGDMAAYATAMQDIQTQFEELDKRLRGSQVRENLDAIGDALEKFEVSAHSTDKMATAVENVTARVRDLQMVGLKLPDAFNDVLSKTSAFIQIMPKAQQMALNIAEKAQQVPQTVITKFTGALNAQLDDRLVDAEGKVRKFADVTKEILQDAANMKDDLIENQKVAQDEAHRRASEYAANRMDETLQRNKWVDHDDNEYDAAHVNQARSALDINGGAAMGAMDAISVGPKSGLITKFLKGVANNLTKLAGGWGLALVGAAYVGYKAFDYYYKMKLDLLKRYSEAEKAAQKYVGDLQVQQIQQESQIRIEMIKAVAEIEKKRLEKEREVATLRMRGQATEIAYQRQLLEIEVKRLEMQKKAEQSRARIEGVSERMKKADEYSQEVGNVRENVQFKTSAGARIARFLMLDELPFSPWKGRMDMVDAHGETAEYGFQRAVNRSGILNGTEDIARDNMNYAAAEARKVADAAYRADFDSYIAGYQAFIDAVEGAQVDDYSVQLQEVIGAHKKAEELYAEDRLKQKDKYRGAEILMNGVDKALEMGTLKRSSNGEYMLTLPNQKPTSMGNSMEEVGESWKIMQARFTEAITDARKSDATRKALVQQRQYIKESARIEQETAHYLQERALLQSENLKNLKEQLRTMTLDRANSLMVNWKQASAEFNAERKAKLSESVYQFRLNNPTLMDDPEKRYEVEKKIASEKGIAEATAKIEVENADELLDFEMKHIVEEYEMKTKHAEELHALENANAVKIFQANLESQKEERQLKFRILRRQLDAELVDVNRYGKTKGQIDLEKRTIQIEQKYDVKMTEVKNRARKEDAEAKAAEEVRFKKEEDELAKKQRAEIEEFDKKQLDDKWAKELELMKKYHEIRLKQIQQEVEFKTKLEALAEEQKKSLDDAWSIEFEKSADLREKAAREIFQKGYDELTGAQQESLLKQIKEKYIGSVKTISNYEEKYLKKQPENLPKEERKKAAHEAALKEINDDKAETQKLIDAERSATEARWAKNAQDPQYLALKERSDNLKTVLGNIQSSPSANVEAGPGEVADKLQFFASPLLHILTKVGIDQLSKTGIIGMGSSFKLSKDMAKGLTEETTREINGLLANIREIMKSEQLGAKSAETADEEVAEILRQISSIYDAGIGKAGFETASSVEATQALDARLKAIAESRGHTVAADGSVKAGAEEEAYLEAVGFMEKYGSLGAKATELQTEILSGLEQETNTILLDILEKSGKISEEKMNAKKDSAAFAADQANKRLEFMKDINNTAADLKANQEKEAGASALERELRHGADAEAMERGQSKELSLATAAERLREAAATLRVDAIKTRSNQRVQQQSIDTDLALGLGGAKDGVQYFQALRQHQRESQYNSDVAELEIKQRREMETMIARGGFTEEQKADMEARHAEERASLDNAKKIAEAVANQMGEVGSLRGLVSEDVGSTSGLAESYERIAAAAFGHVSDPTADAMINADRSRQLEHAALMGLLTQTLPAMVQNLSKGNGKMEIPQNLLNALTGRAQVNQMVGAGLAAGTGLTGRRPKG